MVKKKITVPLLILVFLLQLCAPIGLIAYHTELEKNILQYGTDYNFKVYITAIRDHTVYYHPMDYYYRNAHAPYIPIQMQSDGFATLGIPTADKPKDTPYLYVNSNKNFPNRGLEAKTASDLQYTSELYVGEENTVYVRVRVYKGHSTVLGLYVNGTPLDDWLSALNAPPQFSAETYF